MLDPNSIAALAILLPAAASLVMLFRLFLRHLGGEPLVAYQPRRRVPWNALAPLAVLSPLILVLLFPPSEVELPLTADQAASAAQASLAASTGAAIASPVGCALESAAVQYSSLHADQEGQLAVIWSQVALFLLLLLACVTLLTKGFGATAVDLGLPLSWAQLGSDAALGIGACLAALIPVYGLHVVLTLIFEPAHGHPLIEEVLNPSPAMLTAGAVAAVLAAPLFEETAFRLTFQGWLERSEDAALRLPEYEPLDRRAAGVLPGLRHGWLPILASACLFGLAHRGHGAAPGSLILFGAVLGYLYQRTHRIVPSIACHMTFNAISLGSLLLQLSLGAQS